MTVTTTANAKITKEYDKEEYIVFYGGDYEQIVSLHPGVCLITFPEDLHQPKVRVNDSEVKKAVFKIAIA